MPRNRDTTQEAKTFVPKDEYQQIVEAAATEGVSVAEYMRRALRERLKAQNVNAPLNVQHGGSRTELKQEVLPITRPVSEKECSGVLCIDIGNTNIHLGLYDQGAWRVSWRMRTIAAKMPDEYAVLLRSFLAGEDLTYRDITGVAIGSVVPRLTRTFTELVQHNLHFDPLVITHKTKTGVKVEIDQPEQAGADRIINAAAVVALYGAPAIVCDFGTATTFDVVSSDGAYRGGAIAPGINVAMDALVSMTAQLHKIDLVAPPSAIGTNTIHAMQSGIFLGYVAMIEGMVTRIKAALNEPNIKVIGTGGLAPLFKAQTDALDVIAPELTLEGLRVIYEMNLTP